MTTPVLAQRLTAQRLCGNPLAGPVAVAEHLLAVQAQDPRGFRLAVRSRTTGGVASGVDRALTADRTLLVSWLNRGTLHLVTPADYWLLHPLTTPQLLRSSDRRLAQEQVSPAAARRGVETVRRALADCGPLTRAELRDRVAAAGVRVEGQAMVHILFRATLHGLIVRGPVRHGEQAFVLVEDWLGAAPPAPSREAAVAELCRRYLVGHGPARDRDLARWANLPLGEVRRGLSAIGSLLADRDDGLAALRVADGEPVHPPPKLLGAFDPLLLGWADREPVLAGQGGLVTSNGVFRPVALVGGRAAGTWRLPAGRVVLEPFRPLAAGERQALDAEAQDVRRFLTG